MLYYIKVLKRNLENEKPTDAIRLYFFENDLYDKNWRDGRIGRVMRKIPRYHYKDYYGAIGRVSIGELLIIKDFCWRQIR